MLHKRERAYLQVVRSTLQDVERDACWSVEVSPEFNCSRQSRQLTVATKPCGSHQRLTNRIDRLQLGSKFLSFRWCFGWFGAAEDLAWQVENIEIHDRQQLSSTWLRGYAQRLHLRADVGNDGQTVGTLREMHVSSSKP